MTNFSWIKLIAPTIGLLIGIVFVAIGSIMTTSSVIKLTLQNELSGNIYSYCEPTRFDPKLETQIELTAEEIAECKKERIAEEKARFRSNKIDNIIDGAIFLIVGITFWSIFRRKKS